MWQGLLRRNGTREKLASAFIGEISAAVESVEASPEVKFLEAMSKGKGISRGETDHFQLPKLVIYESNASQLVLFDSSLARELSYFYTELEGLQDRIQNALQHDETKKLRQFAAEDALGAVRRVVDLSDQLLHRLRPLVSRRQPDSISRA